MDLEYESWWKPDGNLTYKKAAEIILNVWNSFQEFEQPYQEEITGSSAFDVAMRMAYEVLTEKSKEDVEEG